MTVTANTWACVPIVALLIGAICFVAQSSASAWRYDRILLRISIGCLAVFMLTMIPIIQALLPLVRILPQPIKLVTPGGGIADEQ